MNIVDNRTARKEVRLEDIEVGSVFTSSRNGGLFLKLQDNPLVEYLNVFDLNRKIVDRMLNSEEIILLEATLTVNDKEE